MTCIIIYSTPWCLTFYLKRDLETLKSNFATCSHLQTDPFSYSVMINIHTYIMFNGNVAHYTIFKPDISTGNIVSRSIISHCIDCFTKWYKHFWETSYTKIWERGLRYDLYIKYLLSFIFSYVFLLKCQQLIFCPLLLFQRFYDALWGSRLE